MTEGAKKPQVCIVDDDKFLLDMYAIKFGERGYTVETAFNAAEVLQKFDQGMRPGVCLIDIIMPGMDGFELIKQLKERNLAKDTALIILSNLGQKEDIERGTALGASGYIIKANATPTEVVNKVEEILKTKLSV